MKNTKITKFKEHKQTIRHEIQRGSIVSEIVTSTMGIGYFVYCIIKGDYNS